ncbi:thiolase-like protein [Mycena rebaudengoi]|nr:thiolase-like protein [Mycena rebaudengoi]
MTQPLAIIGIAVELPSGSHSESDLDHTSFFEFLMNSGQAYEHMPANRFNVDIWRGHGLGQISVQQGSFLKHIDVFDHVEFGISSRDARAMAPSTRKLLEQCFLALLDSGIDYRRQLVGCYTAATSIELMNVSTPDEYEPRGSFAAAPSMVANRISNHLDLLGPSIPVDTACSSSQTAFHLAVQAILNGDCNAAVVGGCQLNHRFGRAEGCVAVVIKPLEDALRDHDRIYATVLGTSSNSTGSGGPPGAPVAEAQLRAMKVAFKRAGRNPSDVAYVEVHATGTAKGDPTEANWVGEHFRRSGELLIGSVKGNIGHTEIAAFLASLSKVLSIFEHKIIPPNINLSTLNPAIKWREYNLRVPTCPTLLPPTVSRRTLISMSSSGIGGSNGHVVLEAPPECNSITRADLKVDQPVLFMAAGLSPRSASAIADQILDSLSTTSRAEYPAASTVLGRRSKQMSWRCYALAVPGCGPAQFSKPQYCGRDINPLVFVFSGQGPQHEMMGRELFSTFSVFRESIMEMDAVFTRTTGKSIIHEHGLFRSAPSSVEFPAVWPISLTLPAIAMFQMAFFDLLVHFGIRPEIVLGHSAGETAVLYASGAAPKAMAVELAIIRGHVFATLETCGGTMAALSCTPDEADRLLAQQRSIDPAGIVEIACLNSPSAVAISGSERSIDVVLGLAQTKGIFARKIRTRIPIHSSMMDLCRDQYRSEVQALFERYPDSHVPTIATCSTLTGSIFPGPFDAEYFWMNTRSQVLFTPTIQHLRRPSTFVEIAPHPVLSSYLSDMSNSSSTVLSTVRRPKSGGPSTEYRDVLQFLGQLSAAGHNCVDFTVLNSALCSESTLKLPAYPFLKKQFPLYPSPTGALEYHGPLNRSRLRLNRDTHPTLAEHVIRGEPIWPAAGFLEMALEFGATALFKVNFRSLLSLSSEAPLPVNVSLDGSYWKVTSSLPARAGQSSTDTHSADQKERLHADGYLSFDAPPKHDDLNLSEIRSRCHSHVDSDFYPSISYFSSYGPKFQRVTNLYFNSDEALASIRGVDDTAYRPFHGNFAPNTYYLPSRIIEMILDRPARAAYFPSHIYAHIELRIWEPGKVYVSPSLP